jgi:hypothetical protein
VLVVRGNRGAFIVRYCILSRLFCLAYGPFSRELIRALGVGTCVGPAIASNISLLVHISEDILVELRAEEWIVRRLP